jgi:vancomycin resistance protein YoaR
METELNKLNFSGKQKLVAIISISILIFAMFSITTFIIYKTLSYDKIYNGIYVNEIYVGGYSSDQLRDLLKQKYQDKVSNLSINLKYKDLSETVDFSKTEVLYNINDIVDKAWSIGRNGNIIERLTSILKVKNNNTYFNLSVSFNKNILKDQINSLYERTVIPVKDSDILIQETSVTIHSGTHGEHFDKVDILDKISAQIIDCNPSEIDIPVIITNPFQIDPKKLFEQINIEPIDAKLKVENNRAVISPESNGKTVSIDALTNAIQELGSKEDFEIVVPLNIILPKVTAKIISDSLFRDTLSTMTTNFFKRNTIELNRSENIRIALSKINGTVIENGKTFSFNQIVGERTIEGGYKDAYTFVNGKLVADTGGGICQVSSTLYNAVLFSDLPVLERGNHSFAVSYVPPGRDAAVFYGSKDFVFKNDTGWPILIKAIILKGNRIFIEFKGTKSNFEKSIQIITDTKKVIPNKITYIKDNSVAPGKVVLKQHGGKGYVVDTYKIVKENGIQVKKLFLHTSYYSPLEEIFLSGPDIKKLPIKKSNNSTQKPIRTHAATAKPKIKSTPKPVFTQVPKPPVTQVPKPVATSKPVIDQKPTIIPDATQAGETVTTPAPQLLPSPTTGGVLN